MTIERKTTSRNCATRSIRGRRRGGYVLVLVALLLFGLMAMAALVIDIGFARLAQRQMQSAADAAALEGLRFRDHLPPSAQSQDLEMERRIQASTVVAQLFDDNLLADEADPFNFGGGPLVKFQPRENDGGVYASEFIFDPENPPSPPDPEMPPPPPEERIGSLPKVPVYKPVLATNYDQTRLQDDSRGDMVAGKYDFGNPNPKFADVPPSFNEFIEPVTGEYENRFFAPDAGPNKNAFLVRIRRTGDSPGGTIGTSGPPLPYLFARGALMFDRDSPDDPRRVINEGIKVRATSIAVLQPAVCVGDPNVSLDIRGKLGVAVSLTEWAAGMGTTFLVYENNAIGGEAVNATTPSPGEGYVAIYDKINDVNRVIGFGPASISGTGPATIPVKFSRIPEFEIPNASATFSHPFAGTGVDDNLVFDRREDNRAVLFQLPVSGR